MRDASASYWFRVGDAVRVCESVVKSGVDLRGRAGIVQETWEKCDVDPTCCCAEQVDCNMAVRVEFPGTLEYDQRDKSDQSLTFSHFFGEEELVKVTDPSSELENQSMGVESARVDSIAFDGIGCAAFKLETLQIESKFKLETLQIESKTRKIASFDPTAQPPHA
jgi:hypothetical protein